MIRVFVCADSAVEVAGLEALVKSASSLTLAGSSLGRTGLREKLAQAEADVLLERPRFDQAPDPDAPDFADPDSQPPARVWLLAEGEFALAAAAPRDSTVRGLLPVWAGAREIQVAVEAAAAGLLVLHPEVTGRLPTPWSAPPPWGAGRPATEATSIASGESLSPRESEILNLLAAGLANKEIAGRLKISEHTVKFHVTSVFNKLGASSRAEAVALGVRRGLIVL